MSDSPLKFVYDRLPPVLQDAACSLEGFRIERQRYRSAYPKLAHEVSSRGAWSTDRLQEFQDKRLREFVRHAAKRVPFYRSHFRVHGVDPESIRGAHDLARIPPISKQDVQGRPREFLADGWPEGDLVPVHTSGTTGAGLKFWASRAAIQEQWAVWWRYRGWHGLERGDWCDYFGGRPIVAPERVGDRLFRINYAGRQIMHSGYHLSVANEERYVEALRQSKAPWVHGYPSLVTMIASAVIRLRGEGGVGARVVTLGAEKLHDHQRRTIEAAFGPQVHQHYGLAEAVANISECPSGQLHVDEDFAVFETEGARYGTNLSNPAFPLIRYEITDNIELSNDRCPCRRGGRVVAQLGGRDEDVLVLPNGARVGRLDHVFKDLDCVHEAQLQSKIDGEIVVVWRGLGGAATSQRIQAKLREYVGEEPRIDVRENGQFIRTSTGKVRFVVRDLPAGTGVG